MNNLSSMTKKNLFEGYVGPPPVMSRCYSTKANPTSFPGSPLLKMNNYLSNVGHFGKRTQEMGTHRNQNVRADALKMPQLVSKSSTDCGPLVQIVGGFVGSKSQAGCTNLRGREFSLWDVIVDKLIEFMEQPELPKPSETQSKRSDGGRRVSGFILAPFGYETPEKPNWRRECRDFQPNKARKSCESAPPKKVPFTCYDSPISIGNAIDPRTCSDLIDSVLSSPALVPCSPVKSEGTSPTPSQALKLPVEESPADDSGRGTPSNLETHSHPSSETLNADLSGSPERLTDQSTSEVASPSEDEVSAEGNSAVPESPSETPSSGIAFFPGSRLSFTSDSDDGDVVNALSSSCDSGSVDNFFPKRVLAQRTVSECSADSDDSFIVFDCAQDDTPDRIDGSKGSSAPFFEWSIQASEDSGDESDSDVDLDEIDHYILFSRNTGASQPEPYLSRCDEANLKWNSFYGKDATQDSDANCLPKKVKFAQDKDLVKIRRIVAWDFAHRAARVGPWEMYYRDSVRFKNRIANCSALLSPILGAAHRARIYRERFEDPT